jgi:hypothetical protein
MQKIFVVYHEDSATNMIAFRNYEDAVKWIETSSSPADFFIDELELV